MSEASIQEAVSPSARLLARLRERLPVSLGGRIALVMTIGVLLTQLSATWLLVDQARARASHAAHISATHLADAATGAIRYFGALPADYRPLVLEQMREIGGTRFFVSLNQRALPVTSIPSSPLSDLVLEVVRGVMMDRTSQPGELHLDFVMPQHLQVADDGTRVDELPEAWVRHTLLIEPRPAPVLVIQQQLEPGHWLMLATLMPDAYFLDSYSPLSGDLLWLLGLTLVAVLVLCLLSVRWLTRPLARLAEAADAFGRGETVSLPQTGGVEYRRTVQAFCEMRDRIMRHIDDRERMFLAISHDLRTPVTRLKLRTELLDDPSMRDEFHEDLDELEQMIHASLRTARYSEMQERTVLLSLDAIFGRMVRDAQLSGRTVDYFPSGLRIHGKPVALKRALGNLLDNGLRYGDRVDITVEARGKTCLILLRDFGPGISKTELDRLFTPYVRLSHGRTRNSRGMGLGLGIAREIIEAHGGRLALRNHEAGGLIAEVELECAQ